MQNKTARAIHPRNRYADAPPDFAQLASRHESFKAFVFYDQRGRPCIDWTSAAATRELTRVLLLDDYGVRWDLPDGQLCPTVTSRANYIHWLADLLALSGTHAPEGAPAAGASTKCAMVSSQASAVARVRGLDIGVGANCIYPLLGASIHGWAFVGTDVTPVALTWAQRNLDSNPHLAHLIEIRQVAAAAAVEIPSEAGAGLRSHDIGAPPRAGWHGEQPADACSYGEGGTGHDSATGATSRGGNFTDASNCGGGGHYRGAVTNSTRAVPQAPGGGQATNTKDGLGSGACSSTDTSLPVDSCFPCQTSATTRMGDSSASPPSSPAGPIGPALPPGMLHVDDAQPAAPVEHPGRPATGPSWDPGMGQASAAGPPLSAWEGEGCGLLGRDGHADAAVDVGGEPVGDNGGQKATPSVALCKVLVGVVREGESFDFCMCNPPFFETIEQANQNPQTACGGTAEEMVTPGGEVAFIGRIIADSLALRGRITWYSSMVGRKASLKSLTDTLHVHGVPVIRTTEFVQGRTSRWGLAWTFSSAVAESLKSDVRSKLLANAAISTPARAKVSFSIQNAGGSDAATRALSSLKRSLASLGGTVAIDKLVCSISCTMPAPPMDGATAEAGDVRASQRPGRAPCQGGSSPAAQAPATVHGRLSTGAPLVAASLVPCKRSVEGEASALSGMRSLGAAGVPYSFRMDVMQPAPGSLMVSAALDRDPQLASSDAYLRVCESFSHVMATVEQQLARTFAKVRH